MNIHPMNTGRLGADGSSVGADLKKSCEHGNEFMALMHWNHKLQSRSHLL